MSDCDKPLTDETREEAISRCARAVERHMAEFARSGCFAARGDADRARRLMELLIAGRSPAVVARMEAEQQERMRLEPGAELA
jgi:hypothetical protein